MGVLGRGSLKGVLQSGDWIRGVTPTELLGLVEVETEEKEE